MSAERRSWTVAHISDTHMDGTATRAAALGRTVDALRALVDVDLVLLTGDVAQHGHPEEYRAARVELDRLDVPVVVCPGNHDRRDAFAAEILEEDHDRGPLHRVHRRDGLVVLALDSTVPGADHGTLDAVTVGWAVDAVREEDPSTPVLVALHHTPLDWHPAQLTSMDRQGVDVLTELIGALPQVRAVLGGHVHHAMSGLLAGAPVHAAPSVAPRIPPPWEAATPAGAVPDVGPGFAVHALGPVGPPTSFFRRVA